MKAALFVICLVLALALPAYATEFRTGRSITVGADEVIDDDLMAAGNSVFIAGKVTGDVLAAGQTVRVTGPVGGSVMAAGQDVVVTGDVDGSVRAAGRAVTLGGLVKRNAQAAGQTVVIPETGQINKDVHIGSNSLDVDGSIGRLLGIGAQTATIRGSVGGGVMFEGQTLSLGPAAKVSGDVAYRSEAAPEVAQGATITGKIVKLPPRPGAPGKREGFSLGRFIVILLMWFVFGAVGLALLPRIFGAAASAVAVRPWWNLLLGIILLVVTPIAAIIVMVTVVGIPIGVLALIGWTAALIFSGVPVGAYIGGRLLRSASPYLALFVGLLVLGLLAALPVIGPLVKIVTVLFGLAVYARATKGLVVEARKRSA